MFIGGLSWQTTQGERRGRPAPAAGAGGRRGRGPGGWGGGGAGRAGTPTAGAVLAEGLREYFSQFGEVKECLVMRDPLTKRSR